MSGAVTAFGAPAVLVTRPHEDALRWVAGLRNLGLAAEALPLIDIAPLLDEAALDAAWQGLAEVDALMFVSANAVTHFFGPGPRSWPSHLRALAPGPGTARALLALGVPPVQIDAPAEAAPQFDSEALWQVVGVRPWAGRRVRLVRGRDEEADAASTGRNWLAEQLQAAGAHVEALAVYQRAAPRFSARQLERMAQAQTDGTLWLFSSSQAVSHLPPALSWGRARALATHPRIAEAAHRAGFGQVAQCRPTLADVAASIKSAHS